MPGTEASIWATVILATLGVLKRLFWPVRRPPTPVEIVKVKQKEIVAAIEPLPEDGPVGIVFIDDSQTDLALIRQAVEKLGLKYRVKFIRTGAEALSFLVDNTQPWATAYVRLVVLDILMPDVAGLELLQSICRHEVLGHVPIVVFTGSLAKYRTTDVYNAGAKSIVLKTGDFGVFEKRVTEICHYWLTVNNYEEVS